MSKQFEEIKECRVCKSKNLITVLDIGSICVSNFISDQNNNHTIEAPLELVVCQGDCKLLQLKHTVKADLMFREYWYLSGINSTMKDELLDIVKTLEDFNIINDEDFVIDIGSNDGTLLSCYKNKKITRVGFEPALNLKTQKLNSSTKIIHDYFSVEGWNKTFNGKKAKVITAIGMFYDLPDPNKFVSDIVKILDENGLFVIQMMYLPLFIKRNAFDGICHEHLEYYSLSSLEYLLSSFGLELIGLDVREDINEGSGRFFITKKHSSNKFNLDKDLIITLEKFRRKEQDIKINNPSIYKKLKENIELNKDITIKFMKEEKQKGKVIHGYAASTKGNTTLQYYKLNSEIVDFISDRNPIKWGNYTVGSNIKIISEKTSREINPDYYFILAWHFLEEFIKRELKFLMNGGKFIVSMPEFQIIDKENYKNFLKNQ